MVPDSNVAYDMPGGPYPYPMVVARPKLPRDYVVWSIINSSFFNIAFLGFIALVYSIKSRDCKVIGDVEGATRFGRIAKHLNIAAFCLGLLFLIAIITVTATSAKLILEKTLPRMSNE